MFRFIASTLFAFSLGIGAAMADDCTPPGDAPSIPNGKTASQEEMVAGSEAVREFQAGTQSYLDCIDAEDQRLQDAQAATDKPGKERILKQREAMRKEYNAAVDDLHKVAGAFNQAIKDFNAQ